MPSPGSIVRDQRYAQRRATLALSILPLYRQGQGCKLIGRALSINPIQVRTILIEQEVYQPGKLKRLKGGPHSRFNPPSFKRVLMKMRVRVRRCLNKKPPRVYAPTHGMTSGQEFKWRYSNDPAFRIYQLCRSRMKKLLRGVKRYGRCMELVGCTTAHLCAHIEGQFRDGMGWSNSGTGPGLWHIDHRLPCASFDLTREDQQRECFHWSNLRPLWSIDNMRKGKRIE